LSEPGAWIAARAAAGTAARRVGSLAAVFADPELRRRVLLATTLAIIGIFGYWGTNFWVNARFAELLRSQGLAAGDVTRGVRVGLVVLNIGNLVGFLSFIPFTNRTGRRTAPATSGSSTSPVARAGPVSSAI